MKIGRFIIVLLISLPLLITGCGSNNPSEEVIEEVIVENARKALSKSEDHEYFNIKKIKVINTSSEDKSFIAKIEYTVVATREDVLLSTTGDRHILPLGSIQEGTSYNGTFRLTLKKYDKGWDVDSYRRE